MLFSDANFRTAIFSWYVLISGSLPCLFRQAVAASFIVSWCVKAKYSGKVFDGGWELLVPLM
jgi:hypothetical protein